uniref:Uncharacterized protein n=1 Tax=uncultured bacterium contig00104 TaxID=1181571 RepID=A0A806KIB9_9BACT|nr:hypothetical protein [uncultured bacterium contig00104]
MPTACGYILCLALAAIHFPRLAAGALTHWMRGAGNGI